MVPALPALPMDKHFLADAALPQFLDVAILVVKLLQIPVSNN
jgi:hypothetical protein